MLGLSYNLGSLLPGVAKQAKPCRWSRSSNLPWSSDIISAASSSSSTIQELERQLSHYGASTSGLGASTQQTLSVAPQRSTLLVPPPLRRPTAPVEHEAPSGDAGRTGVMRPG